MRFAYYLKVVLIVGMLISAIPAFAQFSNVSDGEISAPANELLNIRRTESKATIAQVFRIDSVSFTDGGIIVLPTINSSSVYLTLSQIDSNSSGKYFNAIDNSNGNSSGFFAVEGGIAVTGSVSLGGGSYISVESVEGAGNQHVLSRFDGIKMDSDSVPSPGGVNRSNGANVPSAQPTQAE